MEKKVAIISIFDNANFGTYLQNLALSKVIENYGCNPETINYRRKKTLITYLFRKASTPLSLFKQFIGYCIESYACRKQKRAYKKHGHISKEFKSIEDLRKMPPKADIYITGSDQVWNSIHNNGIDPAFYLDFLPSGSLCYAYAASIGMERLPDNEKYKTQELLKKYQKITVREDKAKEIIEELGFKNIQVVADPTLLLTKRDWTQYASPKLIKEKYLLIYSVESKKENKVLYSIAQEIAQIRGLKTVSVNSRSALSDIGKCSYNHHFSTFNDFLSLFLYCDFCVVSSFHGTAFAINFQKEFLTITPNQFGSRIDSLLKVCQLENRKITSKRPIDIQQIPTIDYKRVNGMLDRYRNESLLIIKSMII